MRTIVGGRGTGAVGREPMMFKGYVELMARVSTTRITFPKVVLTAAHPHIDSIEVEAPTGKEVIFKVNVAEANDSVSGTELAASVAESGSHTCMAPPLRLQR